MGAAVYYPSIGSEFTLGEIILKKNPFFFLSRCFRGRKQGKKTISGIIFLFFCPLGTQKSKKTLFSPFQGIFWLLALIYRHQLAPTQQVCCPQTAASRSLSHGRNFPALGPVLCHFIGPKEEKFSRDTAIFGPLPPSLSFYEGNLLQIKSPKAAPHNEMTTGNTNSAPVGFREPPNNPARPARYSRPVPTHTPSHPQSTLS